MAVNAQERVRSLDFATTKIEGFEIDAKTSIQWADADPYIDEITCEGDNQEVSFTVNRQGAVSRLNFAFDSPPDKEGNRENLTYLGDTLWFFIDGKKFEFRNVGTPGNRFSNHIYKPRDGEGGEIILIWNGYQALKKFPDGPPMHISMFYKNIVDAGKVEWSFKSRNWTDLDQRNPKNALPAGWETRRYRIDNKGLRAAVDWCAMQVASEAAKKLPPAMKRAEN